MSSMALQLKGDLRLSATIKVLGKKWVVLFEDAPNE